MVVRITVLTTTVPGDGNKPLLEAFAPDASARCRHAGQVGASHCSSVLLCRRSPPLIVRLQRVVEPIRFMNTHAGHHVRHFSVALFCCREPVGAARAAYRADALGRVGDPSDEYRISAGLPSSPLPAGGDLAAGQFDLCGRRAFCPWPDACPHVSRHLRDGQRNHVHDCEYNADVLDNTRDVSLEGTAGAFSTFRRCAYR